MFLDDIKVESVSFDWCNDYSSWRLDDINSEIDEALSLFLKYEHPIEKPESIYQLTEFSKRVRLLYRDEKVSDGDSRRALLLSDLIFFNDEIAAFDTEIAYNDAIEMVRDILPKWESKFDLICNDEESIRDILVLLDKLMHRRDGLGERWRFEFYEDFISLPDGTTVKGFTFDRDNDRDFVEFLEYTYSGINNYKELLTKFTSLKPDFKKRVNNLLSSISDKNQSIDSDVINFVISLVESKPRTNDIIFISNFENLFNDWQLELFDLLKVSAGLT
jgi:hypothetical protein